MEHGTTVVTKRWGYERPVVPFVGRVGSLNKAALKRIQVYTDLFVKCCWLSDFRGRTIEAIKRFVILTNSGLNKIHYRRSISINHHRRLKLKKDTHKRWLDKRYLLCGGRAPGYTLTLEALVDEAVEEGPTVIAESGRGVRVVAEVVPRASVLQNSFT